MSLFLPAAGLGTWQVHLRGVYASTTSDTNDAISAYFTPDSHYSAVAFWGRGSRRSVRLATVVSGLV